LAVEGQEDVHLCSEDDGAVFGLGENEDLIRGECVSYPLDAVTDQTLEVRDGGGAELGEVLLGFGQTIGRADERPA
jgi:hypothetical protein